MTVIRPKRQAESLPTTPLTLRIPPDIYATLSRRQARKMEVSTASYIIQAVEAALDRARKEGTGVDSVPGEPGGTLITLRVPDEIYTELQSRRLGGIDKSMTAFIVSAIQTALIEEAKEEKLVGAAS